jgi:hypothetical protein
MKTTTPSKSIKSKLLLSVIMLAVAIIPSNIERANAKPISNIYIFNCTSPTGQQINFKTGSAINKNKKPKIVKDGFSGVNPSFIIDLDKSEAVINWGATVDVEKLGIAQSKFDSIGKGIVMNNNENMINIIEKAGDNIWTHNIYLNEKVIFSTRARNSYEGTGISYFVMHFAHYETN